MVKLEDYTIKELKKMISSFNKVVKFAGYSTKKKVELIKMIRTHPKIKVEEGANAVKLSIKTDETFLKKSLDQKEKAKKEKVKKEVKKEVEKLDKGNIVVDVDKAKKAGIKIDTENPNIKIKKKEAPKKEPEKKKEPKKDTIVDLKEVMNPIFDKKFNPKSVVDRIDSKKDIDDINKEITIIQKKVKEVSAKSKSSGKETEAETRQLQKLQEKYTKRLNSIIKSMKTGASYL